MPSCIALPDGTVADVHLLDLLIPEPGSCSLLARGSLDVERLDACPPASACCLTRATSTTPARRRASRPVDRSPGWRGDPPIVRPLRQPAGTDPDPGRLVPCLDGETAPRVGCRPTSVERPALTVARLYHSRWPVECCFTWSTPPRRLQACFGPSEHAVKTPSWSALAPDVLIAILRTPRKRPSRRDTLLQIVRVTLCEPRPVRHAVMATALDEQADEHGHPWWLVRG